MTVDHEPTSPTPTANADRLRAVFLDRDGTLTEPRHYPSHPDELVLQQDIGQPLRALQHAGFALVVVTNQSGLARGLFDAAALDAMHHRLRALLARHGVRLDGIYACPHHPEARCPVTEAPAHAGSPPPACSIKPPMTSILTLPDRGWSGTHHPTSVLADKPEHALHSSVPIRLM